MLNSINDNLYIHSLSDHLFWDIDKSKLDINNSKKIIIHRVLDYGLISDWKLIVQIYGIHEITQVSKKLRDLDIKSAGFVANLSNTPIEDFACYTTRQLTPQHWNF
ncbi:DUF6922 domain-containing protein [Geofilum rubicundum]|uniref:DUF6922 domain-containing protein n=1 Tax=Geofilum rubicundum TaxID=472113 RepID=UPI000784D2B7